MPSRACGAAVLTATKFLPAPPIPTDSVIFESQTKHPRRPVYIAHVYHDGFCHDRAEPDKVNCTELWPFSHDGQSIGGMSRIQRVSGHRDLLRRPELPRGSHALWIVSFDTCTSVDECGNE